MDETAQQFSEPSRSLTARAEKSENQKTVYQLFVCENGTRKGTQTLNFSFVFLFFLHLFIHRKFVLLDEQQEKNYYSLSMDLSQKRYLWCSIISMYYSFFLVYFN